MEFESHNTYCTVSVDQLVEDSKNNLKENLHTEKNVKSVKRIKNCIIISFIASWMSSTEFNM